ncbi:MAG: DUF1257 domain-containing protein [bacterium]
MSHFTTIQTQVRDIEALRAACSELGLEVCENSHARGYSGIRLPGEVVIRLKGPYDIALNQQADGSYGMTTDWWSGHVASEVGANYGRLLQLYGVHKATQEARHKGYGVKRQALNDGSIKLCIVGV